MRVRSTAVAASLSLCLSLGAKKEDQWPLLLFPALSRPFPLRDITPSEAFNVFLCITLIHTHLKRRGAFISPQKRLHFPLPPFRLPLAFPSFSPPFSSDFPPLSSASPVPLRRPAFTERERDRKRHTLSLSPPPLFFASAAPPSLPLSEKRRGKAAEKASAQQRDT